MHTEKRGISRAAVVANLDELRHKKAWAMCSKVGEPGHKKGRGVVPIIAYIFHTKERERSLTPRT